MTHPDRLPWAEARRRAAGVGTRLPGEQVALDAAIGRVLAAPVRAAVPLPHFASAAMDGWAVAGVGPWRLVDAGPLEVGDATPIVTGGLLPEGAEAVVRSESAHEAGAQLVRDHDDPRTHVRAVAEEAVAGEVLVAAGTRLSPAHVALAAAAGADRVEVSGRPRAALIFTGDEVVLAGIPSPGRVRDSFGPTLPALLGMLGATVADTHRIGDDREATVAALRDAVAEVVVTTGGTGDSHADHVRRALDDLGAEYLVPGLDCRPGGPTLLARLPGGRLVLGLPGNPLAAFLGLLSLGEVLVAGFTDRLMTPLESLAVPASVKRHPETTRLVPVHAGLQEVAWTGSGMMRGLATATAVLVVPPVGDGQLLPLPWTTS